MLNYQRVTPKKMSLRFFWSRFSSRDRRIWSFLDWRGKCTDSNPVLGWNFRNLPIAQEEMRPSTGKKITVAKPWKKSSKFQCIYRWQIMSLVKIHAGWWFGTFGLFFHILGMSFHPNRLTPSFFRGVGLNHQPGLVPNLFYLIFI